MKVTTDISFTIYSTNSADTNIGTDSAWYEQVNPGSGKTLTGWKWDSRDWPNPQEVAALAYAPACWDPSSAFAGKEDFLSGIGSNDDLKIVDINNKRAQNKNISGPVINHGYYYHHDEENYLYSDDSVVTQVGSDTISGVIQYVDLPYQRKVGIPVKVCNYEYDFHTGEYKVLHNLRKRTNSFTGIVNSEGVEESTRNDNGNWLTGNIDTNQEEFVIDSVSGLFDRVYLNNIYDTTIGTTVTGFPNPVELVGYTDGSSTQYHLRYSPVNDSYPIQVYTWPKTDQLLLNPPTQWTVIPDTSTFASYPTQRQAKVDTELGTVTFNLEPLTSGWPIYVSYTQGIQIEFEPIFAADTKEADTANLNPLYNSSAQGVIQILEGDSDPASVSLSCGLTQDINDVYLLDTNSVTQLQVSVVEKQGLPLVNQLVTFEIETPIVGSFGNLNSTIETLTDANGMATAWFVPPKTLEGIGQPTLNVVPQAGYTSVVVENLLLGELEETFLYRVATGDSYFGTTTDSESGVYTQFLQSEGILASSSGSVASYLFEKTRREEEGLPVVNTFSGIDLITGPKILMVELAGSRAGQMATINPVSGEMINGLTPDNTFIPLFPLTEQDIGSPETPVLELHYPGTLPALTGTIYKSYFVVTPPVARIHATTISNRTGKAISSDDIRIRLTIPDSADGLKVCDTINDIDAELLKRAQNIASILPAIIATYSGDLSDEWVNDRLVYSAVSGLYESYQDWFTRTRKDDSERLGLTLVTPTGSSSVSPVQIPLGYRLQSPGLTIASMLNRVTWYNYNKPFSDDYYK